MFVDESGSGAWNALSAMLLNRELSCNVSNRQNENEKPRLGIGRNTNDCLASIRSSSDYDSRVYRGDDFGDYYSDPPYWSYTSHGSGHSKSAHWFYKNHRHIFIDIKLSYGTR
jgi:hypothetical protein